MLILVSIFLKDFKNNNPDKEFRLKWDVLFLFLFVLFLFVLFLFCFLFLLCFVLFVCFVFCFLFLFFVFCFFVFVFGLFVCLFFFFHSQLINLDTLCPILPHGDRNKNVTLDMRLLWKYIRKSKLVIRKRHIFFYNFQSIVNLKLKFWIRMRENNGLPFDTQTYYIWLSPGGWENNGNILF